MNDVRGFGVAGEMVGVLVRVAMGVGVGVKQGRRRRRCIEV